jgi:type IV secretory pathway VirB10-like protein
MIMDRIFKGSLCFLLLAVGHAEAAPTPEELGVVMAPQLAPHGQTAAPAGAKTVVEAPGTPSAAAQASGPPSATCPPEDALFLPTAFSFPALLTNAVYSYATSAPVLATIEDDVKFRDKIVLPRGTHLMGNASAMHTVDRVNISWSLAVLPEGCEFPISAIALSADDGAAGIKGRLEKHEDGIAAHIALQSMITAAGTAAAAASPTGSVENALTGNFSNEAGQNVNQSLGQVKSLESIYIHERTEIRVFVLHRFMRSSERR